MNLRVLLKEISRSPLLALPALADAAPGCDHCGGTLEVMAQTGGGGWRNLMFWCINVS
jgi:hypothetical protein